MTPHAHQLNIELHETTFFASHELHELYFTEALIGNYALVYAFGLARSPYNRTHVGYADDLPALNERGVYVTPAWPVGNPNYRIERFNCQSESFYKGMIPNAVVEVAGRQYLKKESASVYKYMLNGKTGKKITPTNRPQNGVLKMLSPMNSFRALLISSEKIHLPRYIRLGKFMSKAKVECHEIHLHEKKLLRNEFSLINPIDLTANCRILFGDTINIHPVPLIRKADIEGHWWLDQKGNPICPAGMTFGGLE